jgi:hypothetical protein
MIRLLLILLAAGCADDPCVAVDGTCLTLVVRGEVGAADALSVMLSGAVSFQRQDALPGVPLLVGIEMPAVTGVVHIAGAALHQGVELAAGTAVVEITTGHHSRRTITLLGPVSVDQGPD